MAALPCFIRHSSSSIRLRPKAAEEALALPIHPELTDEQIVYVAGKIRGFLG